MAQSNGRPLYEQVLDYARREIDEAASKIDELRRSLHLLEARVEAAKAVYESVAARLNLEDELVEGAEFQAAPYSDEPLPLQAPEPPEDREASPKEAGNGTPEGFSVDLIRRHLEQKAAGDTPEPEAEKAEEASEASEAPEPAPSEENSGFGLSEADRQLISEYLRSKREE